MRTHVSPHDRYFADSYQEARRRFREVAATRGAEISSLPLQCRGPDDEPLTIDIGWFGSKTPARLLMHCSGIHGVEGFAGSAIQLRILEGLQPPAANDAIVLVHVLNPFGMAWLRRFNEHNVDLSRNWLDASATWAGVPEVYRLVDDFLNPSTIRALDLFYLKASLLILRYGMSPLRQAIVGGQFEHPEGLFYGGGRLEEGPALFKGWLDENLSMVRRLFVLDVHTGLGRWRQNMLFFPLRSVEDDELPDDIRQTLVEDFVRSGVGYDVRGGHAEVYTQLFGSIPVGLSHPGVWHLSRGTDAAGTAIGELSPSPRQPRRPPSVQDCAEKAVLSAVERLARRGSRRRGQGLCGCSPGRPVPVAGSHVRRYVGWVTGGPQAAANRRRGSTSVSAQRSAFRAHPGRCAVCRGGSRALVRSGRSPGRLIPHRAGIRR